MSYVGKVNIGGTEHSVGSTLFGRCSTEADATVKIVTLDNFDQLIDGVTIHVLFDNKNTATQPSLNVNGTGAKSIKRFNADGMMTPIKPYWKAGSLVEFTYFSNKWIINNYQSSIDGEHLVDASSEAQEDGAICFTEITNNDDTYTLLKDVKVKGWDDLTDRVSENEMSLSSEIIETSASNPLTFTTRSAQNAQSAEIILEPIQDLHGYDHPWPAGGGKNQLNLEDTVIGETSVSHVVDILVGQSVVTAVATTGWQQYRSKIQLDTGAYIASVDNVIPSDSSIKWRAVINDETAGSGVPFAGYDLSYKMQDFNIIEGHEYSLILRLNQVGTAPVGSKVTFTGLMIRLASETDPTFAPYSNICPISGHTEVNLLGTNGKESTDPDYVISNDLTKDLGMEVYGASYNPVSGELVVTWGHISEYNGETLTGEWISDRDVYEPNTSPSTGAEVAYELATPITYHLSPDEIKLLSGVNTIWTDGTSIKIAYRDGKVATLADLDSIEAVSSMDKLTDVELTDLQDGHSLVYDGNLQKWVNSHLGYDTPVIYSEEEREIGVWTDGKPLYQKTVFFQSRIKLTQYSWADIYDASQVNIEKFVDFTPYTFNQVCPFGLYLSELNSSNHIRIVCLQDWAINGFTFRYTKTTDVPGSGKWTIIQGAPAHHYSTDEQVIGTWTDGKPLYEKTIEWNFSDLIEVTSGKKYYTPDISSGISIKNEKAIAYSNSMGITSLGSYNYNDDSSGTSSWTLQKRYKRLLLIFNGPLTQSIVNVTQIVYTIQYTKTTDVPGSGKWTIQEISDSPFKIVNGALCWIFNK